MKFPFKVFKTKRIYADWAATTPVSCAVVEAMAPMRKVWANPSSIYKGGVEAKCALETVRRESARLLGVKPEEVYFTSGGTEANATIVQGVLRTKLDKGIKDVHVVTTAIEHSSILETLRFFETRGLKVTYVQPDKNGIVDAEEVLKAITPDTALVTVMYANNEIGTVQPVSKIGAGIRKIRGEKITQGVSQTESQFPVFHVDASQAPLWLSCEVEGLRADAITLDAHKMRGPKGVGALIVRRHVSFEPLMIGGGQERGKRPTTESVILATGFTAALDLAHKEMEDNAQKARATQKYFIERLQKELPDVVINGSLEKRLPNNINISIPKLPDPELAVLFLDKQGIACSTKSSCLKGEEESYVVAALNSTSDDSAHSWRARNTLRFTLAPNATRRDVDILVDALKKLPQ